jgi:hypothetical protein
MSVMTPGLSDTPLTCSAWTSQPASLKACVSSLTSDATSGLPGWLRIHAFFGDASVASCSLIAVRPLSPS